MSKTSNKIFRAPEILDEDNREKDYLDFSNEISRLKKKLNRVDKTSFISFTARHGSGKTTILNQLWGEMESYENLWMQFDAWKYPNREGLWENFVLDFFRKFESELFKEALQKFDNNDQKSVIDKGVSIISKITHLDKLFDIIDILSKKTPIKRDFQIQELFIELFKSSTLSKAVTITIILEDIDRSGDKGIYFLETLNYFLKSIPNDDNLPIFRVIVPMEENFLISDETKRQKYKNAYSSYLKVFDQTWKLDFSRVNYQPFIEELFTKEIINQIGIDNFSIFFRQLAIETPRELQLHLRHVIDLYDHYVIPSDALNWDPRIVLFITLNKSSGHQIISNTETGTISTRSLGFRSLQSCANDQSTNSGMRGTYYFVADINNKYITPIYFRPNFSGVGEKEGFLTSNKYLDLI